MSQIELFKSQLPKKPYCTDHLGCGLVIRSTERALGHRYIQPNHPNSKLWLVYDIDRQTSPDEITDDLGLPAPHLFVQNPKNQHAHALYALDTPVHLNPDSSKRAIRFAGALDASITQKMGADAGYCGLITKNPLHEDWRVWSISSERYELNELAEYVDLERFSDQRRALPEIGLGRNCSLFEKLRLWSYKAIRQGWPDYPQFLRACEDRALAYNTNLETPLPIQEIGHIAKSVAKWTHAHFTPSQFSERQAYRGSQGGKAKGKAYQTKKERALQMLSEGKTQKEVSEELGIHRNTVRNYKMHK